MIRLFNSTATVFDTLGLGNLSDAISCFVMEERNGAFEVALEYPIDGIHYSDISLRKLIVCKPNPFDDPQAFRIYYISKPINGIVTINAEHISYDLSGIVVSPLTAKTAITALNGMKNNSLPSCNFSFYSNKEVQANFKVNYPMTFRSLLGGTEGSILDVFGTGEYKFDNFKVSFLTNRGMDRGVTIRYGKNLTDLTQEENCSKVYTAVYPYWFGTKYENDEETEVLVTLDEKIVNVSGTFNYSRIYPLDTSSYFSEEPTKEQLKQRAQSYISQNGIGKPEVSLKVSFLQLEQAEEYEQLKLLESVYLCDTVTVLFPELGVDSKAKCIKTEYNVLTDRYVSLEFGDSRTNLANTIVSQSEAISEAPTTSFMDREIKRATDMITQEGLGGYVMLHNSGKQSAPDELLILDENSGGNITKAQKVWRFNKAGLGFSSTGYNGPYSKIAITMDGKILADEVFANGIKAGTINAAITMIAPLIQNKETDPTFVVDKDGNITGSNISASTISGTNISGGTISGTKITGSTYELDGKKGKLTINSDGWIVGTSSAGDGSAIDLYSKNKTNNTLYGSLWMHAQEGDAYLETHTLNVLKAGKEKESDKRLKNKIKKIDIDESVDMINNVNSYSFQYKDTPGKTHFGVIAQELLKAIKKEGYKDEEIDTVYKLEESGMYSVSYVELIPHLMNYVKHLQNEIDKLREEINKNES